MSKYLDLGYGTDIRDLKKIDFYYKKSNLITQNIPFPDKFFDSVSAFDFIEHVPRIRIKNEN